MAKMDKMNNAFRYLGQASTYLAMAAYAVDWHGICIYSTAILHYSFKQHYPDINCVMVAGWAERVDVPLPKYHGSESNGVYTFQPYAHYWLELNVGKEVRRIDCAELVSRYFADPHGALLDSAHSLKYHPVRIGDSVIPALMPYDLPHGVQYFHLPEGYLDEFCRNTFNVQPKRVFWDILNDRTWRPGMVRRIVDGSGGMLVMP